MGVETGDGVNLADRPLQLQRQLVQLVGGKEPVASLDRSEFVEQELLLAFALLQSGRKSRSRYQTAPEVVHRCGFSPATKKF